MFNQIVIIDKTGLKDWALEKLKGHSENPVIVYNDIPSDVPEAIDRIKEADAVFVSHKTRLGEEVLSQCKNLKYVGMCCSLYDNKSANVDVDYGEKHGIVVKGIRDYGDDGLVEFVISELIRLIKGTGNRQWKPEPLELTNRKVGIIGLGASGTMLARRLHAFGSQISYFSRTRKPLAEKDGMKFLPLHELLQWAEIISLHLPRNTSILNEKEFEILGSGKILVNTSIGFTFEKTAFENWISDKTNFAIFDSDGIGAFKKEFENHENVISTDVISGRTSEALERLSHKVLKNLDDYLDNVQK